MKNFFNYLLNTLEGGCIILGLGLIIAFNALAGEEAGGAGLLIALGLYIILKQYKSKN